MKKNYFEELPFELILIRVHPCPSVAEWLEL